MLASVEPRGIEPRSEVRFPLAVTSVPEFFVSGRRRGDQDSVTLHQHPDLFCHLAGRRAYDCRKCVLIMAVNSLPIRNQEVTVPPLR